MSFPKQDTPKLKIVEDIERPNLVLKENTEWRKVDADFAAAAVETAENYVFELARNYGANAKLIADRFGLDQKAVEATFGHIIKKGKADLVMTLFADQINAALESSSAQMKQHAGKFFAGQIENQTITATDANDNKVEFQVKLVKVEPKNDQSSDKE